ncbi:MAG: YfiR family protein [Methylobacter sp.]|nr:MAG: YfiR family protein [Methylobacter sp.]
MTANKAQIRLQPSWLGNVHEITYAFYSPHPSPITIHTTFLYYKYNRLQVDLAPSPVGEGWGEENKNKHLYPPHPNLLPQGRRSRYLCRYLCYFSRLLLALLLAGAITGQAYAESGSEAAVKTAFLYNFFKFIEWPKAAANQDAYRLCTTNNDQLGDSLSVLESKTVNSKPMLIERNTTGEGLKNCHMVFIDSSENTTRIIRYLKNLPIVTVSDEPGFIDQGGTIGLIQGDNRLSFEINLAAANANGVHISAQLLKLARRVNVAK